MRLGLRHAAFTCRSPIAIWTVQLCLVVGDFAGRWGRKRLQRTACWHFMPLLAFDCCNKARVLCCNFPLGFVESPGKNVGHNWRCHRPTGRRRRFLQRHDRIDGLHLSPWLHRGFRCESSAHGRHIPKIGHRFHREFGAVFLRKPDKVTNIDGRRHRNNRAGNIGNLKPTLKSWSRPAAVHNDRHAPCHTNMADRLATSRCQLCLWGLVWATVSVGRRVSTHHSTRVDNWNVELWTRVKYKSPVVSIILMGNVVGRLWVGNFPEHRGFHKRCWTEPGRTSVEVVLANWLVNM